ncbi:hypothetical protein [Enterobacter cloacae]|nr:hypothetical protein [Enterobacter cloacae]
MIRKQNISNAQQMIEGHWKFLERNTGLVNDNKTDHFVLNPQNVLANNRHFIAETGW